MFNSNGGKVVLYNKCTCQLATSWISLLIRILEQSLIATIGSNQTVSNINFKDDKESIIILVKKVGSLVTTNYNLYLPSQTQVVQILPWEPTEKVKNDIINREVVPEPVQLGSHEKIFVKGKNCGFHENKEVMVKNLKADPSKRTRLADRMISKGNKFTCYVSGFANYNGGHMYYGITDDGVVQGELIPNEEDKKEIRKKVEKAINKMIWPRELGQTKQEKHWEIFFEPVVEENGNHVRSTFVIVIYIAPCLGGVFTEEPECYEMVEGKVRKMSFTTIEKRILQLDVHVIVGIPTAVQRIKWSSSATERHCAEADDVLMTAINNGRWELFLKAAKLFEDKYPEVEMKLVVLSKRVIVSYRRGCFRKARLLLNDYHNLLSKTKDPLIFEVLHLYLQAALKRVARDFEDVEKILQDALLKAENLPPGFITAATLLFAAMNQNSGLNEGVPSPAKLSRQVLEHLKYVRPESQIRLEMEQKAHIILATFHLGYNMSRETMEENVSQLNLEIAKSSVMALNKSVGNGYPLSRYREVQFNLTYSTLYYRYSQIMPEKRELIFLEEAYEFSKKAQHLARACNFDEMLMWANASVALCTEKLVLASLKQVSMVRKMKMRIFKVNEWPVLPDSM